MSARDQITDDDTFSDRLKIVRKIRGLSAQNLSDLLTGKEASRAVIANIESGRTGVSIEQMRAIADALEIDVRLLHPLLSSRTEFAEALGRIVWMTP